MCVTSVIDNVLKQRETVSTANNPTVEDIKQRLGTVTMESINTDTVKAQVEYSNKVEQLKNIKEGLNGKLTDIQLLDNLYVNKVKEVQDTITLLEDLKVKKQQTTIDLNKLNTEYNKALSELKEKYEDKVSKLEDRTSELKEKLETAEESFKAEYEEKLKEIEYKHNKALLELKDQFDKDNRVLSNRFKIDIRDNEMVCNTLQKEIDELEKQYADAVEYLENYEDNLNSRVEEVKNKEIEQINKEADSKLKQIKLESETKLDIIKTQLVESNKIIENKQAIIIKLEADLEKARDNFNALVQSAK